MTEPSKRQIPILTEINGQKVITADWATLNPPYDNGRTYRSDSIIEVLLTDESTVYVDRHFGGDCDKVFDKASSVHAHWKVHGPSAELRRTEAALNETQAELDKLKAKKQREFENRSNGAKRAAAERAARAVTTPAKPTGDATKANRLVLKIQKKLDDVRADVNDITTDLAALVVELRNYTGNPVEIDVTKLSDGDRLALLRKLVG